MSKSFSKDVFWLNEINSFIFQSEIHDKPRSASVEDIWLIHRIKGKEIVRQGRLADNVILAKVRKSILF